MCSSLWSVYSRSLFLCLKFYQCPISEIPINSHCLYKLPQMHLCSEFFICLSRTRTLTWQAVKGCVAGISPDSSDCLGALSHNSAGCWETSLIEYVQGEIRRGRSNLLKTAAHTHRLSSRVPSSFNLSPNLGSRVICLRENKSSWPRGPSRAKDLSWVPQYLTSLFQVMHDELWEFSL